MHNEKDINEQCERIVKDSLGYILNAFDKSAKIPIDEHVLYSSYESYETTMSNQRKLLDGMMSMISEYSLHRSNPYNPNTNEKIRFENIDNFMDKYDNIETMTESLFDRMNQDLDEAAGLKQRDAQQVEKTLANNKDRIDLFADISTKPSVSRATCAYKSNYKPSKNKDTQAEPPKSRVQSNMNRAITNDMETFKSDDRELFYINEELRNRQCLKVASLQQHGERSKLFRFFDSSWKTTSNS